MEVPVGGLDHVARRTIPVQRIRDLGVSRDGPDLLLADVMCPAAAIHALATRERRQREEGPVDRVRMEPVVGAGPHHDHRAALGLLGVLGEFPSDACRR